jgi:oligopeptide transport system substrate-binding protein
MGKIDLSKKAGKILFSTGLSLSIVPVFFLSACSELEKPTPDAYYAETAPLPRQEFRWSNGRAPKSFDPALASVPPETDIVRAIFDGLTELDAKTLEAAPAIAEKWTPSADFKTWTFHLRKNAKWSNGKPVRAQEFVDSWKRVAGMGSASPRAGLLQNIAGTPLKPAEPPAAPVQEPNIFLDPIGAPPLPDNRTGQTLVTSPRAETPRGGDTAGAAETAGPRETEKKTEGEVKFGVEAVDEHTLKVSLIRPDQQFPRLAANPVFRPVYDPAQFEQGKLRPDIVTNGAFRISSVGADGITLDRADYYWNRGAVQLERVKFVPKDTAEQALAAYKAGELDAVTNSNFEPLALKLLAPYGDFRRTKYGALNMYEFNMERPPFNDRRVREALAISIERERLTEGEMEGSSQPALSFLPSDAAGGPKLVQDAEKAKKLLADAGYANGENFPVIRLVVNRNDAQQRIARSVARMWKQNLNLETEVSVKDTADLEAVKTTGDFDLVRRGVVLPTSDETANILTIFPAKKQDAENSRVTLPGKEVMGIPQTPETALPGNESAPVSGEVPREEITGEIEDRTLLSDEDAMRDLAAIPLYFPMSYSLVKSYVQGFEINSLDAPILRDVRINTGWQPGKPKSES